jgi:DNA-binding NarL/FixJ family response regulator
VSRMKKPQPIRLVIAHSHTVLREGLRLLLESEGEFKVIGEASDGTEVVPLVRQLQPDVLLIYPRLPKLSGWEALRELKTPANATSTRVILLEAYIEESKIVEPFQLGVRGSCSSTNSRGIC